MTNIILHIPAKEYIQNLAVDDRALNCFGKYAPVTRVSYRDSRTHDNANYIGVELLFGSNGSTISQSYTEGELIRTVALSNHFTSHQIDNIEQQMKHQGIELVECTIDEIWDNFLPF